MKILLRRNIALSPQTDGDGVLCIRILEGCHVRLNSHNRGGVSLRTSRCQLYSCNGVWHGIWQGMARPSARPSLTTAHRQVIRSIHGRDRTARTAHTHDCFPIEAGSYLVQGTFYILPPFVTIIFHSPQDDPAQSYMKRTY